MQYLFGRFYHGRIGIRLLVDTHLALRRDVLGDTLPASQAATTATYRLGEGPLGHTDYQRYVWTRLRELERNDRKYHRSHVPKP